MIILPLTMLLLGSDITVYVEELGELPQATAIDIAQEMARAIEARTSSTAQVDDPVEWECTEGQACLGKVLARTGSRELVALRLFGGVRTIRVIAERHASTTATASIDLARTSTTWHEPITALVTQLFPPGRPAIVAAQAPIVAPADQPHIAPYFLFGTSAVATGLGVAFGVSNARARDELESDVRSHDEFDRLSRRARTHGMLANVFVVSAAVSAIAGAIFLVAD